MSAKGNKRRSPTHKGSDPSYALHKIQARRRNRNIFAILTVIIVVAVLAGIAIFVSGGGGGTIAVGATVPSFTLGEVSASGLTGNSITVSSHNGSVILLEFMVSWCPHCQNDAPIVQNIYQNYASSGVYILSVAQTWTDANGVTATVGTTQSFIQTYGSQYKYVMDMTGGVAKTYGVTGTPTFFVIDKTGKISAILVGEQTYATLSSAIQVALSR